MTLSPLSRLIVTVDAGVARVVIDNPPVNVLDIQRAWDELAWKPAMAFEEGVAMSVQWLRTVP